MILTNFGSISGTWEIFWCPGDCKLSPDVALFVVKWTQQNFLNFHFRASFWAEIEPEFTLKNERIADTALRASWFWPTLARFTGKWGIFSGTGDSKVTPDCLGLHWNRESKTFSTLPCGLLSRNITPLQFKTERVAETVLGASWFWPTSARLPETSGLYSSPKDSKLTLMALVCSEMDTANFFNAYFRNSGPKYSPTSL